MLWESVCMWWHVWSTVWVVDSWIGHIRVSILWRRMMRALWDKV
jgi:hypothetical protein